MTPAQVVGHAVLVVLALSLIAFFARVGFFLFLRKLIRDALSTIGRRALDKQPDRIRLTRVDAPAFVADPRIAALSDPLLAAGFADLGVHAIDKMPGVLMRVLLKEEDAVAAFVYRHAKTRDWLELSVRYEDGATTACSNRPSEGLVQPPFFRVIRVDPATPPAEMLRRILAERPPVGIKRVTRDTVIPEFEDAYMRIIVWQKNKGLSPEEVFAVVKKWSDRRKPS